ncbi:Methionyl-tRNA formyltransferase, mitochondrial [Phytophthora ramorum]|uniref:Methionyl-tRNA formyltransferase, mitochondrial n=1 Tax=Phytophthora ramorum TaxID=164328 RepID=UPI0030AF5B5B|nr:Methionyl-tRNA formyltransferase, mitochondrial [Phytophthora ramorum]
MTLLTSVARRHGGRVHPSLLAPRSRHFSLAAPGQPPYRVLFFGTDDVSLATLKSLHANSNEDQDSRRLIEHIEVVCPSDRPMNGRKKDEPDFPVTDHFDVGVVVSFGYFLHPQMLRNLHHGAINMHPSLLPKYRGPAPIHHALLNGDTTTGVSVIEIDPKAFDVGRILLQESFNIKPGIQCQELAKELAVFGADCIVKTLSELPTRKKTAEVQDDATACKAPKLTFKDGFLSLGESADKIFQRWQALSNSVGVSVRFKDKVVKLIQVRLPSADELQSVEVDKARNGPASPGIFFFEKKRQSLWLRCENDTWLLITKLQQEDRKVGTALDFCNGYRLKNTQRERFEKVTTRPVKSKL